MITNFEVWVTWRFFEWMAKKLKETYRQTYRQTDRLPLVVLSAAVAAKNTHTLFRLLLLAINLIGYRCLLAACTRLRSTSTPRARGSPAPSPTPSSSPSSGIPSSALSPHTGTRSWCSACFWLWKGKEKKEEVHFYLWLKGHGRLYGFSTEGQPHSV